MGKAIGLWENADNQELQKRAIKLFEDSLIKNGFLCLETKETIRFSGRLEKFIPVDVQNKIYKKS